VRAGAVEQRRAAGDGEPRLLLAADRLDGDAGRVLDAAEEGRAIAGAPARLGRNVPRLRHAAMGDLPGADLERLQRAQHRRLGEDAAGAQPLAEPHDAREGVDDAEATRRAAGDEQAAIVGAEVEGGIYIRRPGPAAPCGTRSSPAPVDADDSIRLPDKRDPARSLHGDVTGYSPRGKAPQRQ